MTISIGQILHSHYQIQSLLGQGGMGAVYRAFHMSLNRICAIKENLDASPAAQAQFLREAQILAQLRHPNLPQVYEYFIETNGRQYLVMEFIAGEDMQSLVRRSGPLAEAQVTTWTFQVLDALNYLHTRVPPVIHRDIKPANIRITPEGRAILVDFGISKVWTTGQLTTAGARAVTPGYSPPEQYGQGTTDLRSDLYALGATMYFVLTATEPCEAVQRLSGASLKLPRMLNPALSPQIERVILRAMDLIPQNRFQTAQEMHEFLTPPSAGVSATASGSTPAAVASTAPVSAPPANAASAATEVVPPAAVPAVPNVVRTRPSRYWLVPVLVGNALGLVLNVGATMANGRMANMLLLGLALVCCGLLLLVPFTMGWWGAQRRRREEAELTSGQAMRAGARVGLLCSVVNIISGLAFALAVLGRRNTAADLAGILGVSLVGVAAYVAMGAAGGALSRPAQKVGSK